MIRLARGTRTPLGRLVGRVACAVAAGGCRDDGLGCTDLCPLPLPAPWVFRRRDSPTRGATSRERQRVALALTQNLLVIGLNYLYADRWCRMPLSPLWRQPNKVQRQSLDHVKLLAESWARDSAGVSFSSSRKGSLLG